MAPQRRRPPLAVGTQRRSYYDGGANHLRPRQASYPTASLPPVAPVVNQLPVVLAPKLEAAKKIWPQKIVLGLAGVIFVAGALISWQTMRLNHVITSHAAALSNHHVEPGATEPDTAKPTPAAVQQYNVAPDMPRYLRITKLGVFARVMQVGVDKNNALGTPSNVYDTDWYTGSAKPGSPGAALIDGHVAGWKAKGVFYNLDKLVAGDQIQIERGDGSLLNYKVVRSQIYSANQVDMRAALTPVTAGKPGLNLISCTGKIVSGTSRYSQRVIVFAEQE